MRSIPIRNTTAASTASVGQWPGDDQQHQKDDAGHDEQRNLRAAASTVNHLGFGRAAIDDKRTRKAGANVRQAQSDEVNVFAETLVVARRVGT